MTHAQWIYRNISKHHHEHGTKHLESREMILTEIEKGNMQDLPQECACLLDVNPDDLYHWDMSQQQYWLQAMTAARSAHKRPDLSNMNTFLSSIVLLIRNIFTTPFLPHTTQSSKTKSLHMLHPKPSTKIARLNHPDFLPSLLGAPPLPTVTTAITTLPHVTSPSATPQDSLFTAQRKFKPPVTWVTTKPIKSPQPPCFNHRYCPYTATAISLYYHRRHVRST